ncbi:unnamed protein product [Schistosoma margrebowiei]|uniref:Uncharacterized protein n=1 Tax=Schistosoma margrebowiei TaxID=48269 RepID=A0A183LSQ5_9TREM|nr:unnamed protein product [Schistosoma margrebowiei]
MQTEVPDAWGLDALFFTESRLLQRDVTILLESVFNQTFVGSILHPNGNIAELLLRHGLAHCIDWNLNLVSVPGAAEAYKIAERLAKEKRLRVFENYQPTQTTEVHADSLQTVVPGKIFSGIVSARPTLFVILFVYLFGHILVKICEVGNGDNVSIKCSDGVHKFFLSSIRAPRPQTSSKEDDSSVQRGRIRPLYDIPYVFEAREVLRQFVGKQDYGPKVNFKRQKVHIGGFAGLPAYSRFLITRYNDLIRESKSLRPEFLPVELCNLEYKSDRGACIVPHYDDSWLWGDRLVTVNLSGATYLTFTLPTTDVVDGINHEFKRVQSYVPNICRGSFCVRVLLDRRSLVVVSGPARYIWQHEIRRSDIPIRRIAMTFRELSSTFSPESGNMTDEQKFGKKLLEIASTYPHM